MIVNKSNFQLNVILAVSCYQQFKERLDARVKNLSDSVSPTELGWVHANIHKFTWLFHLSCLLEYFVTME